MGKKQKQPAPAGDPGSAKKSRKQQPGIAAAFAAAAAVPPRAAEDLVLEQRLQRDLLDARHFEELSQLGEKYMEAWAAKCYEPASSAKGSAAAAGRRRRRSRAPGDAADEKDELDMAGLNFLDKFRQVQALVLRHGAAFDARHLVTLVFITRSDVMHNHGDVSHQAYLLLDGYLRRFPYASLGRQQGGQYDGRPLLLLDEQAAWQPLAAIADLRGLSKKYLFEEAIKDAGHNYRLDHGGGASLAASHKKGGHLRSCLALLTLFFDRALDSVDEDHNGDIMLLHYLVTLLHQDLAARLAVFHAYADADQEAAQRRRLALLQNSLLWRIWLDEQEDDKARHALVRLLMQLIVGVASEEELQQVDEEHVEQDKAAEQASPCIWTPRELAALAAAFLNMLLDLLGEAEAAGGFHSTAANRLHRKNARLRLDHAMKDWFWKRPDAVCHTGDASRTFLAALAPAHRLRLLSLVAIERVSKAYKEVARSSPVVHRATEVQALVEDGESGPCAAAFEADPVLALQCLNHDKNRALTKVFATATRDSAINNLAVLASGIVLAAQALLASGARLPACSGASEGAGSGGAAAADGGVKRLQREAAEFIKFLADKHREFQAGEKKERGLVMSREALFSLVHAHAALAAF